MSNKINFDAIRQDYPLSDFVSSSNVKLKKDGKEFWASCPFHGEKTASFHIYNTANTQKFHCFGCGAAGDIFDYAQELYSITIHEAVEMITGNKTDRPAPRKYAEVTDPYVGYTIKKPPKNQPKIVAGEKTPWILNPKRVDPDSGKPKAIQYTPSMVFPYHDRHSNLLGYVIRVEFSDKKITPGVWWAKNEQADYEGWSHGSYPEPRPLYGLDQLYKDTTKQVLLTEGEKCKDAGHRLLGSKITSMSWMGGGKSIAKVYWKSLAGRSVILWPDNDAQGWATMLGDAKISRGGEVVWTKGIIEYLFEVNVERVKLVHITPEARKKGWDIADAEQEGLDGNAVALIIKDRIQTWSKEKFAAYKKRKLDEASPKIPDENGKTPTNKKDDNSSKPPAKPRGRSEIDKDNWRAALILNKDGDALKPNSMQNIALMLQFEKRFEGIFAWNEFAKEVYIMRRPIWDTHGENGKWKPRMIIDTDVTSATCWLEYCGLSPKANDVGRVVQRVAQHNSYNPVTDALKKLVWDGKPRLSGNKDVAPWLSHYLGADQTDINRVFGMKWMIGAVARAFQPGCKMDNMIILEGPQGLKKSAALRVLTEALGPNLFTDEISDPGSKDAGLQMQGSFVVEIAELDAFRKAEITQIKAWLTRQIDKFRRPYGKIVEDFPRSCVFAGTVNPSGSGYLKDATGARRFWPVRCYEIKIEALTKDALQLWAEAVQLFNDGNNWWLDDKQIDLAQKPQEDRYEYDPFGEMVDEYCSAQLDNEISIQNILVFLDIPKERRSTIIAKRIGSHLFMRGYKKMVKSGRVYYQKPD